jgi:hypothetical protein
MNDSEYKPLKIGDWIITLILVGIPLVNIIMLIVWAVGGSVHPSKKSFAKAYLIIIGAVICIAILGALAALVLPLFAHAK